MQKIAVLSDVHGNLMALSQASEEISRWGPDRTWFLGDAVVFGPDPAECLKILHRDLGPEICIEGNTDRYLREGTWRSLLDQPDRSDPSYPIAVALSACDAALNDEERALLGEYRRDVQVEVEGIRFHLCHGAPGDDEVRLAPDVPREEVVASVEMAAADVVLCGHTHIPWRETIGSTELVNDGSVGYPFDGNPLGAWCALEVDAGRVVSVEFRRFDFDREETIRRLERFGPLAEVLVRRLRTGRQ